MLFCLIFIYVILLVINSFDGQIMVDWNSDPRLDSIRHYLNQRLQSEHHKWHSLNKNNHRLPNIIHSSAKNRSKSNGALFYNRIPKCGSSTVSVTNSVQKRTDLGSLIGNFDCGYSTVWKFSNFPSALILREINFG